MIADFQKKLLEALKSGRYAKGNGALKREYLQPDGSVDVSCFCVLGVACDLLAPYAWNPAVDTIDCERVCRFNSESHFTMPQTFITEINVTPDEIERLVEANDRSPPGDWTRVIKVLEEIVPNG